MSHTSKSSRPHIHQANFSGASGEHCKTGATGDNGNTRDIRDSRDADCQQDSNASVHQDFHWVEGWEQGSPYAKFLETTLDVTAGIHTCLQIAYASDLERAANRDADAGETVTPAIGMVESDQLVRLSMTVAAMLRDEARRRVEVLNV